MSQRTFTNGAISPASSLSGPLTITETAARGVTLNTRSVVTTFPVPCFRPTTTNSVLAFDIMPNGSPTESPGNGYAWFDVCDADVRDNNAAVKCARVATNSSGGFFGTMQYNGASAVPMHMGVNGASVVQIDTSGNFKPTATNTRSLGTSSNVWTAVYATNGTIQTSDVNLKTDILDLHEGLEFINNLRPVSYRWKEGDTKLHFGFIAQEVETQVPDDSGLVISEETKSLAYAELIAPLVKAVQELSKRVSELEGK